MFRLIWIVHCVVVIFLCTVPVQLNFRPFWQQRYERAIIFDKLSDKFNQNQKIFPAKKSKLFQPKNSKIFETKIKSIRAKSKNIIRTKIEIIFNIKIKNIWGQNQKYPRPWKSKSILQKSKVFKTKIKNIWATIEIIQSLNWYYSIWNQTIIQFTIEIIPTKIENYSTPQLILLQTFSRGKEIHKVLPSNPKYLDKRGSLGIISGNLRSTNP